MAYVLLTASGWVRENSDLVFRWADQVDYSDGHVTNVDQRSGGPERHIVILSRAGERELTGEERTETISRRTLRGLSNARDVAGSRGRLGLAVGHGEATASETWVDLAPGRARRVTPRDVIRTHLARSDPSLASSTTEYIEAFGRLVRGAPPLRRIDLYTCSIAGTHRGRQMLCWLHYLWRVPLRGLTGRLEFAASPGGAPRAIVHWEQYGPPPIGYDIPYTGRITEPTVWVSTRAERPPS